MTSKVVQGTLIRTGGSRENELNLEFVLTRIPVSSVRARNLIFLVDYMSHTELTYHGQFSQVSLPFG